jgi:hypothetical protein
LKQLIREGYVTQVNVSEKEGTQGYRVKDFDGLLNAWERNDHWRKRTTVQQFSVLENDPHTIARELQNLSGDLNVVFTQWFAAWLRQPYTTVPIVSAYVRQIPTEYVFRGLIARPVANGGQLWLVVPKDEGVFLETQEQEGFKLACDIQIYLDLLEAGLRGEEAAEELRKSPTFKKLNLPEVL